MILSQPTLRMVLGKIESPDIQDHSDESSGLDASIGFEADRDENLGITFKGNSFINETILGVRLP